MSNAFSLFGLEPCYGISNQDLDNRFQAALAATHPDRFVGKTDLEKRLAAERSQSLTEAYQTLKNPLTRAAEVLLHKGISVPGQNGQTVDDVELLQQVMGWREALAEAKSQEELDELYNHLMEGLVQCELDFDGVSDDELPLMYLKLVYLTKTLEDLGVVQQGNF